MSKIQFFKRPFIWLIRFRNRCGYGVHSPFAFDLITNVFYEKRAYYAYDRLMQQEKKMSVSADVSLKVKRLLFRMVNRIQPALLIDAGDTSVTSLYLQAAKKEIEYRKVTTSASCQLGIEEKIDLLYIHKYKDPSFVEELFNKCLPHTHEHTVFIVEGICYSRKMKLLWKEFRKNEKVFITFDLYDLGILYFDSQKNKQHYIVNF